MTDTEEAEAALATGDFEQANHAGRQAASLLRQPFLPGEEGSWVEAKRRELANMRARALSVLADACLRSGHPSEAAKWAEQAIALEPFRESGYRRLMQAHVAAGDRAEALRAYERCRRLLADELGAYPSPETVSIHRELLDAPSARRTAEVPQASVAGAESAAELAPGQGVARRRFAHGRRLLGASLVVGATAGAVLGILAARDSSPAALVRGDAVAEVDAATSHLIGSIPLESQPAAIAAGAGSVWVAYANSRSVARISPTSMRVTGSITLDTPAQGLVAAREEIWAVGSNVKENFLTLDRIDPTFDTVTRVRRLP